MCAKNQQTVRFAAIQFSPSREKTKNVEKAAGLIRRCVRVNSPDVVALPELFSTPFFPFYLNKAYFKLAEEIPSGPTTRAISALARELGVFIIAPIFERSGERYYDSSPVISPSGEVIGTYRKSSIPETVWNDENVVNHEKYYFSPGDGLKVFDLGKCRLGQLICYDRHFPEAWATLRKMGAQIVYVPNASTGRAISEMFVLESRAMSAINGVYSIVSNRAGVEGGFPFFGGTTVVDPRGKVLSGPARGINKVVVSDLRLHNSRKSTTGRK